MSSNMFSAGVHTYEEAGIRNTSLFVGQADNLYLSVIKSKKPS